MKKTKTIFGSYRVNWVATIYTLVAGLLCLLLTNTVDPALYPGQSAMGILMAWLLIIPSLVWMGFLIIMGAIGLLFGCEFMKKKNK